MEKSLTQKNLNNVWTIEKGNCHESVYIQRKQDNIKMHLVLDCSEMIVQKIKAA